ncbi:MAG: histidine kinase [Desertifilum sp. SIO1I2]|nr:histidine kinase [Desertifilum sp. SIO1I2]
MSNTMKEKIAADLEQAKAEGTLRTERIREIVKEAVSQAVTEFKEGASEIRLVAKDAISTVISSLGEKGKESKEEIAASIEGVIEGMTHRQQEAIAQNQARLEQLQAEVDAQEQELQTEINGALVEIESTGQESPNNLRSLIENAVNAIKERKELAMLQRQYARVRMQLIALDEKLTNRYGDRYDEVKQQLENAQAWYETKKAEVEAGATDPVQQKQIEVENKAAQAGSVVARKEREVKQQLKELWQTVTKR